MFLVCNKGYLKIAIRMTEGNHTYDLLRRYVSLRRIIRMIVINDTYELFR